MRNKILLYIAVFIILNISFLIHNCECQWVQGGAITGGTVFSMAHDGNNMFAGTFAYGVFRSTDNALTWNQSLITTNNIYTVAVSGVNVYAGSQYLNPPHGLFISTNYGNNWSLSSLYNLEVNAIVINGSYILAGTSNGVYYSTNNGINWIQSSLNNRIINCIAINGTNAYAGCNNNPNNTGGVYISTNNGLNWTQTSFNNRIVFSIAVSGSYIFAGCFEQITGNGGIYISTNNGLNWSQSSLTRNIHSVVSKDSIVIAGTDFYGPYLSTNKGSTWAPKNEGFNIIPAVYSLLIRDSTVFLGSNGTNVWKRSFSNLLQDTFTISGNVKYADNNQPVTSGYVKAFKLNLSTLEFETIDSTGILTNGTYTLPNVRIDSVYIRPYPNSTPIVDFIPTFYPSSINWETATKLYVNSNLTNINVGVIRINVTQSQGTISGTVSTSQKSGLNEALVYAKLNNVIKGFSISGNNGNYLINNIPAGTYNVIANRPGYYSDSTTVVTTGGAMSNINFTLLPYYTSVKNISTEVPNKYQLYQNYPNPFNPATKIKFDVPMDSHLRGNDIVSLKVYDLLGREVATLVNEKLQTGTYEISFNGYGLGSGIYFYQLRTNNFIKTNRMILLK